MNFIFIESLIVLPFLIGYFIRYRFQLTEIEIKRFSERILSFNLIFLEPIIIIWFIGKLDNFFSIFVLPLGGLFLVFLGFFIGYFYSKRFSYRNRISIITNLSLANHGYTMGGIVCYYILGDQGLSKALVFISYFYFYLYLFLFPWIQWQLNRHFKKKSLRYKINFKDYRFFPFYGLLLGVILVNFHLPLFKNELLGRIVQIFIYISIIFYYLSLGLNLKFRNLFMMHSSVIFVLIGKFVIIPFITFILLWLIPNHIISEFDKKIIFIMSFMPGAVYSIVSSVIFNLNTKFSVQIFVLSSVIFLIFLLPILSFIIEWL